MQRALPGGINRGDVGAAAQQELANVPVVEPLAIVERRSAALGAAVATVARVRVGTTIEELNDVSALPLRAKPAGIRSLWHHLGSRQVRLAFEEHLNLVKITRPHRLTDSALGVARENRSTDCGQGAEKRRGKDLRPP